MSEIIRKDVNEEWAHTGILKAGDFYYINYCAGNVGGTIDEQINGAFDEMEKRLKMFDLTLENVVQMDCLFRDVWNIPVMERIIKERFHGKYPVRKSIQTEFVDQLFEAFQGGFFVQGGHAHALGTAAHTGKVILRPEKLQPAVSTAIAFGTFKDGLAVMKDHGSGIHRKVRVGNDAGVFPAFSLFIVHKEHMVGKNPAKTKGGFIRRLLLQIL